MRGKAMLLRTGVVVILIVLGSGVVRAQQQPTEADRWMIAGRWDITVHSPGEEYPSWFSIERSGRQTLVGHFVGRYGSARPVSRVAFDGGTVRFSIPPQWEEQSADLQFEGHLQNDTLAGWTTDPQGNRVSWSGRRAPLLRRSGEPSWGDPIPLIPATGLDGWHCLGKNTWRVSDGILANTEKGGNLVTDTMFDDFKLHIEFRYPARGNSGVYLRGRYEVQIEDTRGQQPANDHLGAIYGFLSPSEDAAKEPGDWQSFDITLIGRMVTLMLNGRTVICNQEIPGITGGARDSHEAAPGPLLLQGDHGPVDFRNIVLIPAK
jgi:hypothetical protein